MAKNKKNIAGLIREIILNKKTSSEIVDNFYNQLLSLCIDYLVNRGNRNNVENIAEEIRGEVITNILSKKKFKFFLKDNKAYTVENDMKINSYIYTMIRESYRGLKDNYADKESNLLFKAIEVICKKLLSNGFLKMTDNKYYVLSSLNNCYEYDNASFKNYYVNLRKGKKGEQLDHKCLMDFIIFLFKELENYCFTISILTKVVSENSNFGNMIELRIDRMELIYDKSSDEEENLVILPSNEKFDTIINDRIIKRWINNFKKIYDEVERLEIALILTFYWNGITLVNTSEYLLKKNIAEISKSTIKNRIDYCILEIGFYKTGIGEEDRMKYMQSFIQTLINEFIPGKYIEDMNKMKLGGIKK